MNKNLLIIGLLFIFSMSIVNAYPSYLNITITEWVTQNITFAENFTLEEKRQSCTILGVINITNLNETVPISDLYLEFTNTGDMISNFSNVDGRIGVHIGNRTAGENWTIHIPQILGDEYSVWEYNLSCDRTTPPLNIDTAYKTLVDSVQTKVLAGKEFNITQWATNDAPYDITDLNITMETMSVEWNGSFDNFTFYEKYLVGDYTNLSNLTTTYWEWLPAGGTLPVGNSRNITYSLKAPNSVPTSQTYLALKETSYYNIPYLVSNLTIIRVEAVSDVKLNAEKAIVRPATNVSDNNVTWSASAEVEVPYNIGYNLTKVSVWVTQNISPLATDTPFGYINRTYNTTSTANTGIINSSTGWSMSGFEFNYTDVPPPIVWVKPFFSIYDNNDTTGQIVRASYTKNAGDIYLKYIYVVSGYWLEVNKSIIAKPDQDQYEITIVVKNIGNAWTPAGLAVTVYDYVPAEFMPIWNFTSSGLSSTSNQEIVGGGYNGTSFEYALPINATFNASLAPDQTWTAKYSVNGTGEYKVSDLYIVGLDPKQVDGAGTHAGISINSVMYSYTKEIFYVAGVLALIILNIVNFTMTKRIEKKIHEKN
jgi:hypothetical protein